jgi:hypothetical protein
MEDHAVPRISKIAVLETANAIHLEGASTIGLCAVGRVGDVVLAINVVAGAFDWTEPDDEVEYHHCVRGTIHYEFKYGGQDLPSVDLHAGEILTIPPGVALRGSASDDVVGLVMERAKPWHGQA